MKFIVFLCSVGLQPDKEKNYGLKPNSGDEFYKFAQIFLPSP